MSAINWTSEQLEAINTDGKNIIVTAAAGSGKTAVLTERIVRQLLPDASGNYLPADNILVVTFTRAAAAEMKERITARMKQELKKSARERNYALQRLITRQIKLLITADITTIDSFCLKLVRENFRYAGVSPSFSLMTGGELKILVKDTLDELFDSKFEDSKFCEFLSGYKNETALKDMVEALAVYSQQLPDPDGWLFECVEDYKKPHGEARWAKQLATLRAKKIDTCIIEYNHALELTPSEWENVAKHLAEERNLLIEIRDADFDTGASIYQNMSYATLRFPKLIDVYDKELAARIKDYRQSSKDAMKKLKPLFDDSLKASEATMNQRLAPDLEYLCRLTVEYKELLARNKASRNVLEFSDVEHLAYKILKENTELCRELKNRYGQIMIDEYQDTNALQDAIFGLLSNGKNLFMVGDMKQSIYRFRNGDPLIFKEKSRLYESASDSARIVLSSNFRSRDEVLTGVNELFSAVMSEEVGELEYNEKERLYTGNRSYPESNCCTPEFILTEVPPGAESARVEAEQVANRISELFASGMTVSDKGITRPLEFGDIVILMSSCKSVSQIYLEELSRLSIPTAVEDGDYFERGEIQLILSLLKTLLNPNRDVCLAAVMRSVICGITDDELVKIRLADKKSSLIKAARSFVENAGDNEADVMLSKKLTELFVNLERWRSYTRHMSCDKLIWTLLEETKIYDYYGSLPDGEASQANMRLLFERAKAYESGSYKGLFNFVRYVDVLKKRDETLASAARVSDNSNLVRIMTIHKSKGLEFPVVILAGCAKEFRTDSLNSDLLCERREGIGIDLINRSVGYKLAPPHKQAIYESLVSKTLSEEERKLYVALTRAKEKLIVTAAMRCDRSTDKETPLDKQLVKWEVLSRERVISPIDASRAKCYADWIAPIAMRKKSWIFRHVVRNPLGGFNTQIENDFTTTADETPWSFDPTEILEYRYPGNISLPNKVSATEVVRTKLGKADIPQLGNLPEFMCDRSEITGAELGTAIHYVLQTIGLRPDLDEEHIKNHIRQLTDSGELNSKIAERISTKKLMAFFSSELGQRMLKAKQVFRESEFEIPLPASEIYPDAGDEIILVQGIIDCYFYEGDEIVLIDYKSDRFEKKAEISDKYSPQLDLYALALSKIEKKPIKNSFWYLFFDSSVLQYS